MLMVCPRSTQLSTRGTTKGWHSVATYMHKRLWTCVHVFGAHDAAPNAASNLFMYAGYVKGSADCTVVCDMLSKVLAGSAPLPSL